MAATPPAKPHIAHSLLSRAHSPTTANTIFREKVLRQPLRLRASSPDARDRRRQRRVEKLAEQKRRRKQKPQPLSAKQKRALGVYEIPREERRWSIYKPLRDMWWSYMREILGLQRDVQMSKEGEEGAATNVTARAISGGTAGYVTAVGAGPMVASADFHGAELTVVRSRCVSRVGVSGIVVKDTKFTFEVITRGNELKILPKEHTVFRFEIPLVAMPTAVPPTGGEDVNKPKSLIFELYGSQFRHRAPDRAKKQFKLHNLPDL